MSARVSTILERKGAEVATIAPDATLLDAAEAMTAANVGSLVVTTGERPVAGIVSERDVVRDLARHGAAPLDRSVSGAMTVDVVTCGPATTTDQLMATMTERRIRHVPVVADGALVGIVSIGDVVKSRLDELELQARSLEQYVTGSPT